MIGAQYEATNIDPSALARSYTQLTEDASNAVTPAVVAPEVLQTAVIAPAAATSTVVADAVQTSGTQAAAAAEVTAEAAYQADEVQPPVHSAYARRAHDEMTSFYGYSKPTSLYS